MNKRMTRRTSLAALGGIAAAAAGWQTDDAGAGPAAVASGAVTCVLTPEMTEGPYYVPGEAVRRTITERRPGTPLALRLTVVNASSCKPIAGANVDVWHADALGVYSGVQGNTGTFMRGIQPTNAHGVALFETVYPGWYTGRAVHIHVKVHLGGNVVHTGQLFFPDTLTDRVYTKAPYSSRPSRDTRNATDAIFRNGGSRSMLTLARSGAGYAAALTMGVHRA
ncbi:MAG TPA: intradiol ring-cleavage dioxygenase [Gaiellaceae bacterium]|jgi:protocatechuate 3,4-dioxygenase beta subunit